MSSSLQALLVTGGSAGISSTEIYLNYQWSFAASLPSNREGARASSVQNSVYVSGKQKRYFLHEMIFHFTGGWDRDLNAYPDTILQYNPSNDTWTEVGQLTEGKKTIATATVAVTACP